MTDNPKPPACPDEGRAPARIYGFAHITSVSEALANLQAAKNPACTEAFASGEAECAPSTSTELVRVPHDEHPCPEAFAGDEIERAPSSDPLVAAVIDEIISGPHLSERRKRAPRRTSRKPARNEPRLSSRARHEAHCGIRGTDCQEEIDEAFVHWHSVAKIAEDYRIERRAIYRHAHATGLFPRRDRNLRRALGLIIHRAESAEHVTADSVIRAVRTLAHINDAGEWVNPPTHVIFSASSQRTDHVRGPACPDERREQSLEAAPSAAKLLDTRSKVKKRLKR